MALSEAIFTLITVLRSLIAVSIISLNLYLIHCLKKLHLLETISYHFIYILSISDTCSGIVLFALVLQTIFSPADTKSLLRPYFKFFLYFFSQLSSFIILLVAFDRYLHMRFLIKYSRIMTKYRAKILVCGSIFLTLSMTSLLLCSYYSNFIVVFHITLNTLISVLLVTTFVLYIQAYIHICTRTKQAGLRNKSNGQQRRQQTPQQSFSRTAFFIYGSLVLCYMPYLVCTSIESVHGIKYPYARSLVETFLFTNALWDSVILIISCRKIRRYTLVLLRSSRVTTSNNEQQRTATSNNE